MADSARPAPESIDILGVPLHVVARNDIHRTIESVLAEPSERCLHLVTLNPEYVMAARKDREFTEAIKRADLIMADGIGVALAARLNGARVDRVTGVELLQELASASATENASLFLIGAAPGVAEAAAKQLELNAPQSQIAGWWSGGSADPRHDVDTLKRIKDSGARTVAVAYGAQGQVLWIDRNRRELAASGVRVAVGVGGAFDFVAGRVPRAPGWMQRFGLEWLYRLVKEPWRWRRQLVLPVFAVLVVKEWIAGRIHRR